MKFMLRMFPYISSDCCPWGRSLASGELCLLTRSYDKSIME